MTRFLKTWIAFTLTLAAPAAASAQDRTALLIGNAEYGSHRLARVAADVDSVADGFRGAEFRVSVEKDLDAKAMREAIERFADASPTNGVAVFYFAGLAGQYATYASKGASWNYLQGAGKPNNAGQLEKESLALREILEILREKPGARYRILLLDCCRANPFHSEEHPLGLAKVEGELLGDDTFLHCSAFPGKVTDAEPDGPSAFAAGWIRALRDANQSLDQVVDQVKRETVSQGGSPPWVVETEGGVKQLVLQQNRPRLESNQPAVGASAGQEWFNGGGMVFCWCPPGEFTMGAPAGSRPDAADAQPVAVRLARGFWMGKYEVTQREYKRVRNRDCNDPLTRHRNAPIHNVEYNNAEAFCKALNDIERKAGRLPAGWEYGLPTEAEWEYACRAGSQSDYSFGDAPALLDRFGNFAELSLLEDDSSLQYADNRSRDGVGKSLAVVGAYQANAWGLHDMHGNVWEWCQDRYAPQLPGGTDPLHVDKQGNQVIRGGGWCSMPHYCRSWFRNESPGNKRRDFVGFRVILKQVD